jgi:hypothetical protein
MTSIEKHSFKISIGVAVLVLLFLLNMSSNFSKWKTEMEAEHAAMELRQDHLSDGYASIRAYVDALESRQDSAEITMARVETKLASIESLLIEMRNERRSS